jgi:hypothetical protein
VRVSGARFSAKLLRASIKRIHLHSVYLEDLASMPYERLESLAIVSCSFSDPERVLWKERTMPPLLTSLVIRQQLANDLTLPTAWPERMDKVDMAARPCIWKTGLCSKYPAYVRELSLSFVKRRNCRCKHSMFKNTTVETATLNYDSSIDPCFGSSPYPKCDYHADKSTSMTVTKRLNINACLTRFSAFHDTFFIPKIAPGCTVFSPCMRTGVIYSEITKVVDVEDITLYSHTFRVNEEIGGIGRVPDDEVGTNISIKAHRAISVSDATTRRVKDRILNRLSAYNMIVCSESIKFAPKIKHVSLTAITFQNPSGALCFDGGVLESLNVIMECAKLNGNCIVLHGAVKKVPYIYAPGAELHIPSTERTVETNDLSALFCRKLVLSAINNGYKTLACLAQCDHLVIRFGRMVAEILPHNKPIHAKKLSIVPSAPGFMRGSSTMNVNLEQSPDTTKLLIGLPPFKTMIVDLGDTKRTLEITFRGIMGTLKLAPSPNSTIRLKKEYRQCVTMSDFKGTIVFF